MTISFFFLKKKKKKVNKQINKKMLLYPIPTYYEYIIIYETIMSI